MGTSVSTSILNPPDKTDLSDADDYSTDTDFAGDDTPLSVSDESEIIHLFSELKTKGESYSYMHRSQAFMNENMVNGNQFIGLDTRNDKYYIQQAWFNDIPKKSKPIIANFALTWTSLLVRDRPSVYAVGQGNSIQDRSSAEIATKLIEFLEQDLDIDDHISNTVYTGCYSGTAGIKICYHDTDDGLGDLYLEDLSVHDYIVDPSVLAIEDTPWIIFKRWISHDSAKEIFHNLQLSGVPAEESYYDGHNQKRYGVAEYEFWHRPNWKHPKGFYARILGHRVVDYLPEYPFQFVNKHTGKTEALLPAVFFKCRDVRGSPYGRTFITDISPLQSGINETLSRLFKLWRQTSSVHRIIPKGLQDSIDDENSVIFFDDAEQAGAIGFTEPPQVPPIYEFLLNQFEKDMYDVAGISPTTMGQQESASKAARAIQYQAQLDALKTQDAVKSLGLLVSDLYSLLLKIIQRYWSVPRVLDLFDDETQLTETITFSNADVQGLDIRLQPRSGNETMQAAKERDAMERLQQGLISPSKADSLVGSIGSQLAYQDALDLIHEYLTQGQVDSPLLEPGGIDPEIMVQAIEDQQQSALLTRDMDTYNKLQIFKFDYVKSINGANGAQAVPSAGGAPSGPDLTTQTSAQAVSEPATAPNVFGPAKSAGKK